MSATATVSLMTVEEYLALPEDGLDRNLIRGQLWEKPTTRRYRTHAEIEARIAQLLGNWLDRQPTPRGKILSGEAGCILAMIRIRRSASTWSTSPPSWLTASPTRPP